MTNRAKLFRSDENGASAIEFAIAGPLFLGFVFAIITGGWVFHSASSVRHALETASRQLLISPTLTEAELSELVRKEVAYLGELGVVVTLSYDEPVDGVVIAHAQASYNIVVAVPLLSEFSFSYSSGTSVALPSS